MRKIFGGMKKFFERSLTKNFYHNARTRHKFQRNFSKKLLSTPHIVY